MTDAPDPLRLVLEITDRGPVPEGSMRRSDATPTHFAGWLQLLSALQRAIGDDSYQQEKGSARPVDPTSAPPEIARSPRQPPP